MVIDRGDLPTNAESLTSNNNQAENRRY